MKKITCFLGNESNTAIFFVKVYIFLLKKYRIFKRKVRSADTLAFRAKVLQAVISGDAFI